MIGRRKPPAISLVLVRDEHGTLQRLRVPDRDVERVVQRYGDRAISAHSSTGKEWRNPTHALRSQVPRLSPAPERGLSQHEPHPEGAIRGVLLETSHEPAQAERLVPSLSPLPVTMEHTTAVPAAVQPTAEGTPSMLDQVVLTVADTLPAAVALAPLPPLEKLAATMCANGISKLAHDRLELPTTETTPQQSADPVVVNIVQVNIATPEPERPPRQWEIRAAELIAMPARRAPERELGIGR
jgi:hypothetical protein